MSEELKSCPDCLQELVYRSSSFPQYQPSVYWCNKCQSEKESNYVRGFNKGLAIRTEKTK